jgi:predicted alpha/beta-hydrolase family hydrolase
MTFSRKDSEWRLKIDGDETSALFEPAENERAVFVCAHGAGGHMRDRSMESLAEALLKPRKSPLGPSVAAAKSKREHAGISIVRFNFLYREHGSRRPDAMPLLKQTFAAVIEHVRKELQPRTLIIGGRSMGGRAASMLAADGIPCDGLMLFAYPLHPAGKPEKLRDAHLPQIFVPVLCVNGTRDALCGRDLMDKVVGPLAARWTMHWLDGADHSFHVLKSSGRTDAQVMDEVAQVTEKWAGGLL